MGFTEKFGNKFKKLIPLILLFIIPINVYAENIYGITADSLECNDISIGNNSECNLIGDSFSSDHSFVLTSNKAFQRGAVWLRNEQNIQGGFISEFAFKISDGIAGNMDDGGYPGADGFAFLLQTQGDSAIGTEGGSMGYYRIFNAIAVEFDQYKNDFSGAEQWNDSTGNHVAVQFAKNGEITFQHSEKTTLAMVNTDIKPFGSTYWAKVEYDSANSFFKIWLSTNGKDYSAIIDIENFNINDYIYIPGGKCFIGFTAATGGAKEYHEILSWKICQKLYSKEQTCDSSYFNYREFPDSSGLKLNKNSKISGNNIILTESNNYERGSVWRDRRIPISEGFETEFAFSVSDANDGRFPDGFPAGGDGLAFVIQNSPDSLSAIGRSGSGLGYSGLQNALAFEFDLFANDEFQIENENDPNGNHFALMTVNHGNIITSAHNGARAFYPMADIDTIKSDSTIYYVKIEYIARNNTLAVWLSNIYGKFGNPCFYSDSFKLSDYINLDGGNSAYVGFTASTGDASERHSIHSWSLCPGVFSQKITGVEEAKEADKIYIKLDPAYSEMNIESKDPTAAAAEIYACRGELLGKYPLSGGNTEINISKFPNGVYFVYIYSVGTKKFTIAR